jgi:NADH-quinone oxidoreductase subunit E
VGKYVIHVCDSVICWLEGQTSMQDYLCRKLNIEIGQTTEEGLFTLLPVCCIGYCDLSPAILINKKAYGPLTPEKLDEILEKLRSKAQTGNI